METVIGLMFAASPLALVAGGKSDLCTAQEIADLQALRPDLQLHICPDAGHVPALADSPTQQFMIGFINKNAA